MSGKGASWLSSLLGFAQKGDLDDRGVEGGGERGFQLFEKRGGQIDVVDFASRLVVKMGVGAQVRAVAGGAALVVDLADESALHEGFEAVVNRGE